MIKSNRHVRAQTAIELAVFGAILIFVTGAIIRQSLEAGYQQNQNLKAMRLAMKTSYEYSEGLVGGGGTVASHNRASVLLIEDRLTADSSKFGAIDRTQHISAGSATDTRHLFMQIDTGDKEDLPVYDVFVNGKHFPFTLAGFKTVRLAQACAGLSVPDCASHAECLGDCSAQSVQLYPGPDAALWEPNCVKVEITKRCRDLSGVCLSDCTDAPGYTCPVTPIMCNNDCSPASRQSYVEQPPQTAGCAKLFTKAFNHPRNFDWCDHDGAVPAARTCDPVCPVGGPGCNLSAEDRFDLDRDGLDLDPVLPPGPPDPDVPVAERPFFSWQWYQVMGFNEEAKQGTGLYRTRTSLNVGEGINFSEGKNISLDIDKDLKEESVLADTIQTAANTPGVITQFDVLDSQAGDLDFTIGDNENKPQPGLDSNLKMYTFVHPGTQFTTEEGQLFGAGNGQFIRTTRQKNQADLIERVFRISNDTERFCYNNNPTDWANPPRESACVSGCGANAACVAACPFVIAGVTGMTNPVEACGNCFSSDNIERTCMEPDPTRLRIFIRSRVADLHGHKWITNTSGDDYVDFTLPTGP